MNYLLTWLKQTPLYLKILLSLSVLLLAFWLGARWQKQQYFNPRDMIERNEASPTRIRRERKDLPIESELTNQENDAEKESALEPSKNKKEELQSLNEICKVDWQTISQMNLLDIETTLLNQNQILSQACSKKMKDELELSFIQGFIKNCHENLLNRDYGEIEDRCLPFITPFRAYIIRQLHEKEQDLQALDINNLSNQLYAGLVSLKNLDQDEIKRNINLADAIIQKDPDIYDAYKSKLVNLLVLELKHGEDVGLDQYDQLYDEMLTFNVFNDEEEILIEAQDLNMVSDNEAENLNIIEAEGVDSDLIHLPFIRLSALGNTDELYNISYDYIEAYPNSGLGYVYLAEALWKEGQEAEAFRALKEGLRKEDNDRLLLRMFKEIQSEPMDRLYQMAR